jgi:hypothetical protein
MSGTDKDKLCTLKKRESWAEGRRPIGLISVGLDPDRPNSSQTSIEKILRTDKSTTRVPNMAEYASDDRRPCRCVGRYKRKDAGL